MIDAITKPGSETLLDFGDSSSADGAEESAARDEFLEILSQVAGRVQQQQALPDQIFSLLESARPNVRTVEPSAERGGKDDSSDLAENGNEQREGQEQHASIPVQNDDNEKSEATAADEQEAAGGNSAGQRLDGKENSAREAAVSTPSDPQEEETRNGATNPHGRSEDLGSEIAETEIQKIIAPETPAEGVTADAQSEVPLAPESPRTDSTIPAQQNISQREPGAVDLDSKPAVSEVKPEAMEAAASATSPEGADVLTLTQASPQPTSVETSPVARGEAAQRMERVHAAAQHTAELDIAALALRALQARVDDSVRAVLPSRPHLEGISISRGVDAAASAGTATNQFGSVPTEAARLMEQRSRHTADRMPRQSPRAMPDKVLERVEQALKESARAKDGSTISLRLDPPDLGSVKVDVSLKDGVLHARLVPESPQVGSMLRERAHELQQSLRRLGIDAETVAVSVGGEYLGDGAASNHTGDRARDAFERDMAGVPGGLGAGLESGAAVVSEAPVLDHWVA